MADSAKIKKVISEILDDADLTTITAKKVRQQLEAKLKTDLTDRKKEIDEMVMEILEKKQDEQDEKEESGGDDGEGDVSSDEEATKKKKVGGGGGGGGRAAAGGRGGKKRSAGSSDSEEDYVPEKKAKGGRGKKGKGSDDDASDEDWGKKSRRSGGGGGAKAAAGGPKKKRGGGAGTGFTKTLKLSPELGAVMGQPEMARHEVVKKIWAMIKEKNLYDPKNKQFAICNDELLPIFGVKRFRTFGMMKHLKNHFIS